MRRMALVVLMAVLLAIPLIGCATATPVQKGAMGGAVVGGLAGQVLGGDTKSTLIGAGVGALGGALYNDYRSNR